MGARDRKKPGVAVAFLADVKKGQVDPPPPPALPRLDSRPLFALLLTTRRTATAVVDGGYRVDVEYSGGQGVHAPLKALDATALAKFLDEKDPKVVDDTIGIVNSASLESGIDWL